MIPYCSNADINEIVYTFDKAMFAIRELDVTIDIRERHRYCMSSDTYVRLVPVRKRATFNIATIAVKSPV